MARLCTLALLLVAIGAAAAASNNQTYSSLSVDYQVSLSYVLAGKLTSPPPCPDNSTSCALPQVSVPDNDSIIVDYAVIEGLDVNSTSTITLQYCFNNASAKDRPWRKANDVISKDKKCKAITKGLPPQGNYTYTPNADTPPATYYLQVLEVCENGQYCGKGRSLGYYTIIPIDSRPGWLIALVSVFCCVGPVALATFFFVEHRMKKQK